MNTDIHGSAKALIIKAAEDFGLLREVAELLWFAEKYGGGEQVLHRRQLCALRVARSARRRV